jgi:hypothetical protein
MATPNSKGSGGSAAAGAASGQQRQEAGGGEPDSMQSAQAVQQTRSLLEAAMREYHQGTQTATTGKPGTGAVVQQVRNIGSRMTDSRARNLDLRRSQLFVALCNYFPLF